ncbi:MAG: hypothetical protein B0W54_12950 [Cellvibrio sp. 79]|nr:MAG: hypothetical protein B0W54_12950 [Cellvibrio sp. 79]
MINHGYISVLIQKHKWVVIGLKVFSPGVRNGLEVSVNAQEAGRIVIHLQAKNSLFYHGLDGFF